MAREKRRLAAIVSADVVGYSRLMGVDESGTLATLRSHRAELIDPAIEEHGGRIVKTMGDGLLLEFPSVVDAVQCSIAVQEGMVQRNLDVPEDEQIVFRIGINLGDIIIDGDDIQGDGINIAARLEGLAEPSGICISHRVYEDVRDRLDVSFVDGGEQKLKNIARAVWVWRWATSTATSITASTNAPLALPDKPSIAVLPFENMSGDPEQEYFADGMAEDIITSLSRVRWLLVIARNSSFTYKGHAVDVKQVGRELGVRYLLEGSVRKAGKRLRVTAQLIETETGNHVWAERYDRDLDDIFELQDELTQSISSHVDAELAASEREHARHKPATELNTWDCYQRGMWHFYKSTLVDLAEAYGLFQQAVTLSPEFASAYAALARTVLSNRTTLRMFDGPSADLQLGLDYAERAISLDDREAAHHNIYGRLLAMAGQGERAIAELEKSIDLDPNYADGHVGLGINLVAFGRAADAIPALDKGMQLNPRSPLLHNTQSHRSQCCIHLGNFVEAEEWARKAANARPDTLFPHINLAQALVGQDRLDEARAAIEVARGVYPSLSQTWLRTTFPYYHQEYLDALITAVAKAGVPEE